MDPITIGLAAGGLVSSLFGGYKAARERRKMSNQLSGMEADNKALYNAQALSDYTQRTDSQNVLRQMRRMLDRQAKREANTQKITGGTLEQAAMQKEAANRAIADATARIGALGAQFNDRITDRYINRKNHLGLMRMNMLNNKATGWENFMQTGLNTAAGALGTAAIGGGGGLWSYKPISNIGKVKNVNALASTPKTKSLSGIISNKYNTPLNAK